MNIKAVEESLKDYKRKKSVIETTKERIKVFQDAINNPEHHYGLFLGPVREPGMPSGKGYKRTSPVEYKVLTREKEVELLKIWIKEEKSKIYPLQIEVAQIETAMKALNRQQKHVIECKYFESMFWRDIELSFNETFRQQNYITVSGIRKINTEALNILADILKPFYKRFKTA